MSCFTIFVVPAYPSYPADGNSHGSGMSLATTTSPKTILKVTLDRGHTTPWSAEQIPWMDKVKEWAYLSMPNLLTKASRRNISSESSLVYPPTTQSVKGLDWTELNWTELLNIRPELSLCGWRDVKLQELTHSCLPCTGLSTQHTRGCSSTVFKRTRQNNTRKFWVNLAVVKQQTKREHFPILASEIIAFILPPFLPFILPPFLPFILPPFLPFILTFLFYLHFYLFILPPFWPLYFTSIFTFYVTSIFTFYFTSILAFWAALSVWSANHPPEAGNNDKNSVSIRSYWCAVRKRHCC